MPKDAKIILASIAVITIIVIAYWLWYKKTQPAQSPQIITMEGLQIKNIAVGIGAEAKNGNTVTVNYVGTLDDGTKFDSSYDRKQPFSFNLGAGQVIKGWDLGVAGMKVGGKRELVISPDLAYGPAGRPPIIPPNATLHFTVEILEIK